MLFHDLHEEERRLFILLHSGQWEQARALVESWLAQDPERADCLLRLAQIARRLDQPEAALERIRTYRRRRSGMDDARYLEADCLLALGRTADALHLVEQDPTARGRYYRGCALLARREIATGLDTLWAAFQQDPEEMRTLAVWMETALPWLGARRVRRQLHTVLRQYAEQPAVRVGIGLLLAKVDRRVATRLLHALADRQPAHLPAAWQPTKRQSPEAGDTQRSYGIACEYLLTARSELVVASYVQATTVEPAWTPLLAPLAADMLLEARRPGDVRRIIEEALRTYHDDYRLHLCHARALIQLGLGEEARSAANCALALANDSEQPAVYVQQAVAACLLCDWSHALSDLTKVVSRVPEVRQVLRREPALAPLARDPRYRLLLAEQLPPPASASLWNRVWQWVLGG